MICMYVVCLFRFEGFRCKSKTKVKKVSEQIGQYMLLFPLSNGTRNLLVVALARLSSPLPFF